MKRGKRTEGQSLLEFAIVLPVLLAIVIGIFEFGQAWNMRQVLTNAAREGARLGVIPTSDAGEVQDAVEARLTQGSLDPDLATIDLDNVDGEDAGPGSEATVSITYPYRFRFLGPIVAFLQGDDTSMAGTINLSATVVMRNE